MLGPEKMALSNILDDCIYKMRPSDRLRLEGVLADRSSDQLVVEAIIRYVEGWEGSTWVEDYSITRIGKWFARQARKDLVEQLRAWARGSDSKPRRALLDGLDTPGRAKSVRDHLRVFSAQMQ